MDHTTTIQELKDLVQRFCEERDWDQYHDMKELATACIIEAAEWLEIFRYKTKEQIAAIMSDPEKRQAVGEEMADVLYHVMRAAQLYDIDIARYYTEKMKKNALKYPAHEAKGKNHKYTEYQKE